MVWEELDESLIKIDLEAQNSTDVFKALGGLLQEKGIAKDSYVDALIEREKDFPTGLDIGNFGIAIPHTAAEHVNQAATAIATLKKPVDWVQLGTEDDHVDVNIVFMLAVKDPNAHLNFLQAIVQVFQDKDVMEKILAEKDASKIIEIIKTKEESL